MTQDLVAALLAEQFVDVAEVRHVQQQDGETPGRGALDTLANLQDQPHLVGQAGEHVAKGQLADASLARGQGSAHLVHGAAQSADRIASFLEAQLIVAVGDALGGLPETGKIAIERTGQYPTDQSPQGKDDCAYQQRIQ